MAIYWNRLPASVPLPSRGPQCGDESKRLHNACHAVAPKAAEPLPSRVPSAGRNQNGYIEGTFARRAPSALGIETNVPVVHPNALPLNITPSSSPGTLSTSDTTKHNLNTCPQKHTACCLGGPHVGGMATSPLPSQVPHGGDKST